MNELDKEKLKLKLITIEKHELKWIQKFYLALHTLKKIF